MKNRMAQAHPARIMQKLRGRIFQQFWVKEPPSVRNHFRQKTVYLNLPLL